MSNLEESTQAITDFKKELLNNLFEIFQVERFSRFLVSLIAK